VESFENLFTYWRNPHCTLSWDCFFVLPPWLKVWWSIFGSTSEMHLCAVRHADDLIGIAPFLLKDQSLSFVGDTDVCDYQDFIVAPGRGHDFFRVLLEDLSAKGITELDLKAVRSDSLTMLELADTARQQGYEVSCSKLDVSFEMELPATWDEYLLRLKGKQRHEVRRKLRRLNEAGNITYRIVEDVQGVKKELATFFELFRLSREDKEIFMTAQMTSFFQALTETLAAEKLLKLLFLDVDENPAAAVLCFDHNASIYLYNNGFDINFSQLSVGLLCKVFSIKYAIENGKKEYDFLKGAETYKHRLGGQEVPLYACKIKLK
jgi:CelD/BcsL family acetyltransferase involved in cellulose biosynthesis